MVCVVFSLRSADSLGSKGLSLYHAKYYASVVLPGGGHILAVDTLCHVMLLSVASPGREHAKHSEFQ